MNSRDYKVICVLGNGFDLDLGLKTKYSDFIESDFFRKNIDVNDKSQGYNLFNYLNYKYKQADWIDIEKELTQLALKKTSVRSNGINVIRKAKSPLVEKESFYKLHESLTDYLSDINYNEIKTNSYAANLMMILKNKFVKILTYNYTNLRRIEHVLNLNSKLQVEHIHGSIIDNDIILGFQDDIDIDDSYCYMIKSFSPHYKSHNVRQQLLDADEIIFYGHSLGLSDYHYFNELFQRQSNQGEVNKKLIIRIFTYNEDSRINTLIQLRNMNERKTNLLYDLCDFDIYRTNDKNDHPKINHYYCELNDRLNNNRANRGVSVL